MVRQEWTIQRHDGEYWSLPYTIFGYVYKLHTDNNVDLVLCLSINIVQQDPNYFHQGHPTIAENNVFYVYYIIVWIVMTNVY